MRWSVKTETEGSKERLLKKRTPTREREKSTQKAAARGFLPGMWCFDGGDAAGCPISAGDGDYGGSRESAEGSSYGGCRKETPSPRSRQRESGSGV